MQTHWRWGPWFSWRRGCWKPPGCVMHGSQGDTPAAAAVSRTAPAAQYVFYMRYSPADCSVAALWKWEWFLFLVLVELFHVLGNNFFTSSLYMWQQCNSMRPSAYPLASSYAASWQQLGVKLHSWHDCPSDTGPPASSGVCHHSCQHIFMFVLRNSLFNSACYLGKQKQGSLLISTSRQHDQNNPWQKK